MTARNSIPPPRALPPVPSQDCTRANGLKRTDDDLSRAAKPDSAAREIQSTSTIEEVDHEINRRRSARGPRFGRHQRREGSFHFEGSPEEHRARLVEATGCADLSLADRLFAEVAMVAAEYEPAIESLNSTGPLLAALAPKTPFEGVLTAQMAAIHGLAMHFLARAAASSDPPTIDSTVSASNKLLRTFAIQVEALVKLRGTGVTEQRVVVQHVTVADGGQAVIGAVTRAPRGEGAP